MVKFDVGSVRSPKIYVDKKGVIYHTSSGWPLSFPPKYSIAYVVGFLKGKSAIRLHREFPSKERGSKHFWIRGYFVSTVGLDEKKVREYIRDQEKVDKQQMEFEFE